MSFPRRVQAVNHRVVVSLALCAMFVAPVVPAIAHPAPRVGIMYEGWHAPAVMGLKDPMSALTVERVIRSNGTITMDDMAEGINLDVAMGFFHQKEPLDGFYCIYRKRANESKGIVPDCLNISSTLSRHANMFNQNNISFVVADSTNIVDMGAVADVLQLRPFEVLAEEWLALRTQAIPTPQISVWQQLASGSNLWRAYVEEGGVYSNPAYDALIFKDAATGKKVFFTTPNPDPAIVATLKAPPYNLAVVNLWALRSNFDQGEWSFFSPCTDPSGEFTTSVYSNSSIPCNQKVTTNSPIGYRGTSLTVGPSYQLSYSSLPFMAAGKLGGLTLKKQFERAFELHSLGALDYLFVGTFNEHIAQPQPNPYNPPNIDAVSFGLENDSFNVNLWVDMFGDSISRDLEPTREDGGKLWALFQSCLQVNSCNSVSTRFPVGIRFRSNSDLIRYSGLVQAVATIPMSYAVKTILQRHGAAFGLSSFRCETQSLQRR